MKKFIKEITQYNTAKEFLLTKRIENKFKELCTEYDSSIGLLNFNLTVGIEFNAKEEER